MSIKVHTNAPLSSAIISDTQRSAPVTNDTQWFNHLLKTPASPTQPSSSDSRFSQPLVQRSDYLQALSNKAARALVQTSHNAGPIDIIKSTRAMSAFHLETVLTAKMISKTSQAIEKLTNLS